ncbi:MAG: LysM peptidoglycan-binding domain-containing protein [Cyclobacteriaceae bacterium]|nr:LysM peptidoglycan-binding domain-containing protein [Cyclobacteriaceae bacterium]
MRSIFLTRVSHIFFACFLTLQLCTSKASAQYSRDTVFTLAQKAIAPSAYPEVKRTAPATFFLNDSFSVIQTQKWIGRKAVNPKTLAASLALGNNYFNEIANTLEANGLPLSYKWIPLCLSGMQHNLYGPDGRAGLWQLPHLVAVRYGLQLKPGFDQRLDPQQNTRVAIRYLANLRAEFGDEHLALLAFFNGEGSVRAAASHMAAMRFKDEYSRQVFLYEQLPHSTRDDIFLWNYLTGLFPDNIVPVHITHPNKLNLTKKDSTQLEQSVTLDVLAKLLNITKTEILSSNPSITGNRIPKDVSIFLSRETNDSLITQIQTLQAKQDSIKQVQAKAKQVVKTVKPPENRFNTMHTVRQGDNLGRIAIQYGVSLQQLKEWNNLKSDRINVGQQLIVYTKEPVNNKTPEKISTPAKTTLEPGTYTEYTVKQGDSLWSISRQFPGVTIDDIMRWNNIGERIDIGQVLKIKKQ